MNSKLKKIVIDKSIELKKISNEGQKRKTRNDRIKSSTFKGE